MSKPVPVNKEITFSSEEIFFSTTDKRGRILYGNDVFYRLSKYSKEELSGAPHSIIRHPDMPRCIFKLLWDTISQNQIICAYVKNMAADGSYYWVFATVIPTEQGYLSVRVKPQSDFFKAVIDLYPKIYQVEEKGGMGEGAKFLLETLQTLGFSSYEKFMMAAMDAELKLYNPRFEISSTTMGAQVTDIFNNSLRSIEKIEFTMLSVNDLVGLERTLVETSQHIFTLYKKLKFLAINMAISSSKLHGEASILTVISESFGGFSVNIKTNVDMYHMNLPQVYSTINDCRIRLGVAKLLMQTCLFFINEMSQSNHETHDVTQILNELKFSLFKMIQNIHSSVINCEDKVNGMIDNIRGMDKATLALEIIKHSGLIEVERFSTSIDQSMKLHLIKLDESISEMRLNTKKVKESSNSALRTIYQLLKEVDELEDLNGDQKVA